jgi:hypothetical protein
MKMAYMTLELQVVEDVFRVLLYKTNFSYVLSYMLAKFFAHVHMIPSHSAPAVSRQPGYRREDS